MICNRRTPMQSLRHRNGFSMFWKHGRVGSSAITCAREQLFEPNWAHFARRSSAGGSVGGAHLVSDILRWRQPRLERCTPIIEIVRSKCGEFYDTNIFRYLGYSNVAAD